VNGRAPSVGTTERAADTDQPLQVDQVGGVVLGACRQVEQRGQVCQRRHTGVVVGQ
jgi:hypothetical protein